MTAKITSSKNGISYDDTNTDNMNDQHYCPYKDRISIIDARLNGTEDDPGAFAEVKTLLRIQRNNASWFKGAVFAFGTFLIMVIYFGITDHNIVRNLKYNYIDRTFMNQVLENQSKLNYMIQTAELKNTKDIEDINKQLELMKDQFKFMGTTRGADGNVKKNPIKLSDGTDPEKEYQKSLKDLNRVQTH